MTKNFIFQTMRAVIHGVYKSTNNHEAIALAYSCEQTYFLFKANSEEAVCLKTPSGYRPLSVSGSCTMKSHSLYLRAQGGLEPACTPFPDPHPQAWVLAPGPWGAEFKPNPTGRSLPACIHSENQLQVGNTGHVWGGDRGRKWRDRGLKHKLAVGENRRGGLARYWSSGHHRPVSEGDI